MGPKLRLLAAATASLWTSCGGGGASCTSDLGCSLNGVCTDGRCVCDAAWGGESGRCDELQFEPASFPQGYGLSPPLNSSWGGNPVWDEATRKYHLYTSVLTNGCFLGAWTSHSRIDHSVSHSLDKPFTFKDVAINTQATNPQIVTLHDSSYAIFYSGSGEGPREGGPNCSYPTAGEHRLLAARSRAPDWTCPQCVRVSKSLDGPWTILPNNTLPGCGNPSPWVNSDGSILIACDTYYDDANHSTLVKILRAPSIAGPWEPFATIDNVFSPRVKGYCWNASCTQPGVPTAEHPGPRPSCKAPCPQGANSAQGMMGYEDPCLFRDRRGGYHVLIHAYQFRYEGQLLYRDRRGGFHLILHAYVFRFEESCGESSVSAHLFSEDGKRWRMSAPQPYTTRVPTANGSFVLTTRERPKLFFDRRGEPTHLINGVGVGTGPRTSGPPMPACPADHFGCCDCSSFSQSYTLIAPLKTAQ